MLSNKLISHNMYCYYNTLKIVAVRSHKKIGIEHSYLPVNGYFLVLLVQKPG